MRSACDSHAIRVPGAACDSHAGQGQGQGQGQGSRDSTGEEGKYGSSRDVGGAAADPKVAAAVALFGARRLLPTTPPTLREYQLDALAQVDAAVAAGKRAPLLVLPTGSGKTIIGAELIRREVARAGSALFLAPRRELVTQTCAKLAAVGVAHGVLLAGADERSGLAAPVQVASVDTLASRVLRRRRLTLPAFSLVVVDEAHLSITLTRQQLLALWPDAVRVGLTATPTRKDGRALGVLYDCLLEPATTETLTTLGHLVPARYFSWPTPDLGGVRVTAGDFNLADLEAVMNQTPLLGDVVETWLAHAATRRTIVYATSIAHAVALAEAFRRAGVAAEHVDAKTPTPAREATFRRFTSGDTQVLTNCFLAAYGVDLPALSCVVLARPTRSLMLYLQMLGRGLRPAPGKRDCLVLDHAGCVHRHSFATDARAWTLDGEYALAPSPKRAAAERNAKECPACHAVWTGSARCPECGYELRPSGRMVQALDGELVEIAVGAAPEEQDRRAWYAELRGYATERGFKVAWAAYKYRDKYGTFPPFPWNDEPAAAPSIATRGWLKSRAIAWARSRERVA
jgi:DNA repair protein RadD